MRPLAAVLVPLLLAPAALAAHLGDPMIEAPGHLHREAVPHRLDAGGLAQVGHVNPPKDGSVDALPPAPLAASDWSAARGFEPVTSGWADAGGAYFGEVDARGNVAYLAQLKPPAGVHVLDVTDPAAPRQVGRWNVPSGSGGITDVKVSADGRFLYAAYQGSDAQNGVFVLDVTNPAAPRQVSHAAVPNVGVHMLFVKVIQDIEWVFAATATGGGGMRIGIADAHPLTGAWTITWLVTHGQGTSPHDLHVYDDPLLGVPVMVVADGASGVNVWNVALPVAPVLLGAWTQSGADAHYSHTVRAVVQGERRFVVVSPEGGALGLGTSNVAKLWVLDATTPAAMTVAGSWQNPGAHVSGTFTFSTHNFQLVGDRVYLAHNHGGVWVLDASALPAVHELAYRLPAAHTTTSTPGGSVIQDAIPATWDVVVKQGLVYAADRSGGLYVMHYAGDEIGPNGPTSYG